MGIWSDLHNLITLFLATACYVVGLWSGLVNSDFSKGAFFIIIAAWLEREVDRRKADLNKKLGTA